jgi:hypothetical protein
MRRPPNHKKSKEETDRYYIREEPAAPDQRLSTDTTADIYYIYTPILTKP